MMGAEQTPSETPDAAQDFALTLRPHAEAVVVDGKKAEALAEAVLERSKRYRRTMGEMWRYVQTFARMLRAYARREYTKVPWRSLVMTAAALLYFMMPLDFIPDFLLGGLVDDAAVIAFVVRQVQRDLDAFMLWEGTHESRERPG